MNGISVHHRGEYGYQKEIWNEALKPGENATDRETDEKTTQELAGNSGRAVDPCSSYNPRFSPDSKGWKTERRRFGPGTLRHTVR